MPSDEAKSGGGFWATDAAETKLTWANFYDGAGTQNKVYSIGATDANTALRGVGAGFYQPSQSKTWLTDVSITDHRADSGGAFYTDDKWHHVAVSMPKKDCKLSEVQFYVDGQGVESNVVGQDKSISVSLANKVTIGGLGHGNGKTHLAKLIHVQHGIKPYVGSLDEVSVWSRALTTTEVAELAK